MNIVRAYPPNFGEIARRFPYIKGKRGIMFAFGDTIYNPAGGVIPVQLIAHEEEHGRRQLAMGGAERWWKMYLNEPEFLWTEELFAHRVEFKVYKMIEESPQLRERYLDLISKRFSGPLYDKCISYARARALIDGFENPGPMAS